MSDYDILPKNMPDTTSELADRFETALPEASFKNDYSQLAADIYELFLDPEDITHQPPSGRASNSPPPDENKKQQLRDFIEEALNKKLPQLIEFHGKGYNPVSPDRNALQKLQEILQNERLNIPEALRQPARRFVDTLSAVLSSEAALSPDLLQASDDVLQHLRAALDDLSATRKISTLNWEEEAEQTAREARGELVTRAAEQLFPQENQAAARAKSRQTLDSLLFAQSSALSAEYKKFDLLKASLAAESRLTRQRLAAHLQTRADTLLQGAREARRAALDMLLAESGSGQMHPEQLMHWSQGYQQYARYLQAVDARPDAGAVKGNPLIAAVNRAARQGKPARARLAGSMVPLADALGSVAVHLLQEKQRTEPAPADPQPGQKRALTERIKNVVWDRGRKKGRAARAASVWLAKTSASKVSRAASKTKHTLHRVPAVSEGTRQAISNTALLLLDEIQQAERRLRLLPGYAWVRQEAVQQQLLLSREIADPHESALMDELVSRRLALEKDHWQQIADNAARQMEALLAPLTRLAETTWFNEFYFALSDELRSRPAPGSAEAIARMDETVIQAAEQLAGIGRQLNAAAVRLSGHGHEGGKALQEKAGEWLMTLKTLKSQVKTQAIQLTGQAPDNFSRSGMLARGIAEWAQTLRQDYLAGLTGDERTRANELFDTLLTELLSGQRQHFAGPDDPQAESLLKRVAIALKHTAEGTTVYPPTAEEILAGTRTVPADVQHWAEKKILTGALSAAISGGMKLLTGPVSLPVRIALRGAKTGWTLNKNLRAMNRVRLGEGPANERVRNRLFHQELSKLAFRLTLSLSPAGGYGVAATVVGSQLLKDKKTYARALTKKVIVGLPQEALWFGLAYGGYAGVNAVVRASAERAMQKAWAQAVHARREKINRMLQQFSMADIEEEESDSESDDATDDTATEAAPESNITDEITQEEHASHREPEEEAKSEEKETAAPPATEATQKIAPYFFRSRIQRVNFRGDGPGVGVSLNPTPVAKGTKIIGSRASDSLNDIAQRLVTGKGYHHPNLKNGQEGAVYKEDNKHYIFLKGKYWPIHFKNERRAVITLNSDIKGSEILIDVHLRKNIWLPTAIDDAENMYDVLPVAEVKIDSDLENAVRNTFPISGSYSGIIKGVEENDRKHRLMYIGDNNNFYLYAGGQYYQLTDITYKENSIEAVLNPPRTDKTGASPLSIIYHDSEKKWWLAEPDSETNKADIKPSITANSTASTTLLNRAKWWSITSAYFYTYMGFGKEGQIYVDGKTKKHYIYLKGLYWPVTLTGNSTAVITLQANEKNQKELISIRKIGQQWTVAQHITAHPLPEKSSGNFSIESYVTEFFDVSFAKEDGDKNLRKMLNGLYMDVTNRREYILINGYYWYISRVHIIGIKDKESWQIIESRGGEHLNVTYDETTNTWEPVKKGDSSNEEEESAPEITLTSDLVSEIKKWDRNASARLGNVAPGVEGRIYKDKDGKQYIYLQSRYWDFSWINHQKGAVTVTLNGVRRLFIIHNEDNKWSYFDDEIVSTNFDIEALLSDMSNIYIDSETQAAIESLFWGGKFTSFDNWLNDVKKILDQAFYRYYEKPYSHELRGIILLNAKLSASQNSVAYYKSDAASQNANHDWNEDLLAIYRDEFEIDMEQSTYIYAARQARITAEQSKIKITQLSTEVLDKDIREKEKSINNLNQQIKELDKKLVQAEKVDADTESIYPTLGNIIADKEKLTEHVKSVKAIRENIIKEREKQKGVISKYEQHYKTVNAGIDLAKKTLERQKKLIGGNDKVALAEEALIDLALQKVAIRSAQTDALTPLMRNKLKTLSIAQAVMTQIIERHALSQRLIQGISEHSLTFPELKRSYEDIEWSNIEAEKIYKLLFPADDNAEANQLLAPLLYWLLKNKQNFSTLRSTDIDIIIENYYADARALNPLNKYSKMPSGYIPLSGLLGREYFISDSDYYHQFINYKEKFSGYEASENARSLLLSSTLTLKEMTSKIKKRFFLNVLQSSNVNDKHDGAMLFIELEDGRWFFFSIFPEAIFSREFSREQMMDNIWLRKIATLTPEKSHYHGIESVFLEPFFTEHFDSTNKNSKTRKYQNPDIRRQKEENEFINNTLYKNNDGSSYPSPFKNNNYYGVTYDFSLNSTQPQDTLIETLNKAFRDVLNNSATNRKKILYKPTFTNKIADIVIPFYAEIRGAIKDPEHRVDATSVMLDVVGVCFVAAQAGTKTTSMLKNAKGIAKIMSEGSQKGLFGKGLQLYVIKEMGKQGLISATKLAKISVNAMLDLVSPVSVESLLKKSAAKTNLFSGFDNTLKSGLNSTSQSRGISNKYITSDVSLDDLTRKKVQGVDVYTPKTKAGNKEEYYIKHEDNFYKIRWDDYAQTWRTVDPKNPGRFAYGEPIVFENDKWVINKNYGGLRGGGHADPDIIMGEQPSREGLKAEKVISNLISTPAVNAESHLNKIKEITELNSAILSPMEKCESVIVPVANYMKENGFTDIRCRAMAFFINGMDDSAGNHFLLIGSKQGRDYAFDITAGQFHGQYEELSGPIIMPEEMWAQKYANITSERKLIKYSDYALADVSQARADYGPLSKYLSQGPNCKLPNAKVIKRPGWYFPKKSLDDLSTTSSKKMAGGTEHANPVRNAARRSRLTSHTPDTSWDYAIDLLENAELLGKGASTSLRTGLRQATRYQRESVTSPGALDGLLANHKVIDSQENLLHLKQGELLIFMEVDPALASKGPRPVHVMVSLGNGRFAGVKNSVLSSSFGDGKKILTAEQLGEFHNGTFRRRGNAQLPDLQIISGRPKDLQLEYPSLKSLAEDAPSSVTNSPDIATTTTEFLSRSGELAEEQARALKDALKPMLSTTTTGVAHQPVTSLMTSPVLVNRQQLANVPRGQLIIFDKTSDAASTRHVMYSLGNGEFFMVNAKHLDAGLPIDKAIVKAEQFSDEIFKNRKVYAGNISLTNLRMKSLLGQDAGFVVSGNKLTITAHGAASNVNTMDASELAEVIRGLGLRETSKVDWSKIKDIELKSCFGAFGSLPTGKVLAHILNKKVTAYPFYFSERMRDTRRFLTRARTYLPGDLSTLEVEKMIKQQSRNHDLWVRLLGLQRKAPAKGAPLVASRFDNTLEDVAKLTNGDTTVEQFLKNYPDYKTRLIVTESELKALLSESIPDDQTFAMRCWDILMSSTYTANMVDKYLES
ncbi:hypothetical protein ACNF5A_000203 [Kosakonia cowanii]|uniref:hypothetical protein n=1 Tax=Kosakonia cowanii TaxID=208223 RepID=UPI003B67C090